MLYTLVDAAMMARNHPTTFERPDNAEIAALKIGDHVKLGFVYGEQVERMWVRVTKIDEKQLEGNLDNDPIIVPIVHNDFVKFERDNIYNIIPN